MTNEDDLLVRLYKYIVMVAKVVGIVLAVVAMILWAAYSIWRELSIYSWLVS